MLTAILLMTNVTPAFAGVIQCVDDGGTDFDMDGFCAGPVPNTDDCDDNDFAINPDATEILDNPVDEDCSGAPGFNQEPGGDTPCNTNAASIRIQGDAKAPSVSGYDAVFDIDVKYCIIS